MIVSLKVTIRSREFCFKYMPKGIPKNGINKGWRKKGMISIMKGKHHTKKSKEKNRIAHLGKIPWNKGKKGIYSKEILIRIGNAHKEEKSKSWKGDKVGIRSLHLWVRKRLPKKNFCENCKIKPPCDLANKGIYNRELKNWKWLCRKCHMIEDGRIYKNLIQFRNKDSHFLVVSK